MEVLQWARAHGCPWDAQTCVWAARHGQLAVLQWARSQGCSWNPWICGEAAQNGHLAVVQWARAQGGPWNEATCAEAAGGGHLEVLQWVRAQGCPWDENTCSEAVRGGHLAVLQWARAQNCPWSFGDCVGQVRMTYCGEETLALLGWLLSHGPDPAYLLETVAAWIYLPERYYTVLWAAQNGWVPEEHFVPLVLDAEVPWHVTSELLQCLPRHSQVTPELAVWRTCVLHTLDGYLYPALAGLVTGFL